MGQFPYLDEWFRLRNPVLRNLRKPNAIVSFSVKQMDEHAQNKDEDAPPDFVDRFKAAAEKYSDVMTQEQMEDFVITNVSAGSDTTAIILRATIYFLLTDKLRYNEFMKEVKTTLKARPRNETHHRHISWTEAYNMRYFQAVLKESMRLHPALGQILPRIVPKGGVHLCGKFLPEGTEVGCNAWTVHHDRAIFGEDADTFRPERWLDNDEEKVKNMERHNFVFGAGSRTCKSNSLMPLIQTY
jgi:cytochrome P450